MRGASFLAAALLLALLAAEGFSASSAVPLALLEPEEGAYFGVSMNNSVSIQEYVQEVGINPTTFGIFTHFPLRAEDLLSLHSFLKQVGAMGGIALVTLEPHSGLTAVNSAACRELVDIIVPYEKAGLSFLIRFGQEMNGGWYPWCQRPTLYKAAFRLVARYVRTFTCRTAMMWAPNNGGGYPFSYGEYVCQQGFCDDFEVLDTDGDGKLSMSDDMYTPYYPGDDAVDWVGQTLYHWGRKSPWGGNQTPEPGSFYAKLTGNYAGDNGDETAIPDFYAMFCGNLSRSKPLAIPEISALYNPAGTCCQDELTVKRSWWRQIFNVDEDTKEAPNVALHLPRLKLVVWFDNKKQEVSLLAGVKVDWTFSSNTTVRDAFIKDLQVKRNGKRYWKLLKNLQQDEGIPDPSFAPRNITIITNGTVEVTLGVPTQRRLSEAGMEVYIVNEYGMPVKKMGGGSTILRHHGSWSVDVDIIFKEPQDPAWQQGVLYYSAFVRPLVTEGLFNRSEECAIRAPLRAVYARRGGTRPPAPLYPALMQIHAGPDALVSFVIVVALLAVYFFIRRQHKASKKLSGIYEGAFRYAAVQGNLEVMEEISRMKGFHIDASIIGFSALHAAVVQGQVESVEWLLAHGASVQQYKEEGWEETALHYAAANGFSEIAQILLAKGADPCAKNFQGAIPADLALDGGHMDLASDLYKAVHKWAEPRATADHIVVKVGGDAPEVQQASIAGIEILKSDAIRRSWSPTSVLDNSLASADEDPSPSGSPSSVASATKSFDPEDKERLISRAFYGAGTPDTKLKSGTYFWRFLAVLSQALGVAYFVWRAMRSLNEDCMIASVLFYLCELLTFAPSFLFCLEIWAPVERERRSLRTMGIAQREHPFIDVYVVCYNEPVHIIEATVCAALNMSYPPGRLAVRVLDDGRREEVESMCAALSAQMKAQRTGPTGRGWPSLHYATRTKVKGVPHHAKAGNINSQLLKGRISNTRPGAFVVVFDCDMIPKPEFLDTVIGHFYEQTAPGAWRLRPKLAFVQTPQDFYNVEQDDPMGHRAAFFYGPMMQGRDGIGACPCVGTGVVFSREALVSIGGQAFGSITEDYNSAMTLLGSGFASIYLNERLTYGLAPDDINSVFKQRLRWAMGSLQILCRDNPLLKPSLSVPQMLLFFQSAFQYCLALPTLVITLAPIVYMFTSIGPIAAPAQEFCAFFAAYYGTNRLMLWMAHQGVPNKGHEMWRGSQAWVWSVPNNLLACWKVFTSELWIFKMLGVAEIGFTVTRKDAEQNWRTALKDTWMFLAYYVLIALGFLYNAAHFFMGQLSDADLLAQGIAFAWGLLICLYLWPPLSMSLPWHKPGVSGAVLWDDTPCDMNDVLHQHGHVEPKRPAEVSASPGLWRRLQLWLSRSSSLTEPLLVEEQERRLSRTHSLAGRPHFSLMRRVRDSVTFVCVNGVTLTALVIAGVLYTLLAVPPVQTVLHAYVVQPVTALLQEVHVYATGN